MIEDDYVVLNLEENDLFVLVFFREVEEGNNSSDIDIDNFFIGVSAISPLLLEYGEYVDIFFKSEARQLPDYVLVEYVIDTGDVESLYGFIYNLLVNEFSIFRDNLEEFLEKGYIQRLISLADARILFIFKKDGDR